jgi:hypothetical protein
LAILRGARAGSSTACIGKLIEFGALFPGLKISISFLHPKHIRNTRIYRSTGLIAQLKQNSISPMMTLRNASSTTNQLLST